ncbi:MAG: hypothetical protein AB7Q27_22860 [Acidimicrobiia bacterium]
MQGLDADTSASPAADTSAAVVSIAVSPHVPMSAAKTAVQVAHGAHIAGSSDFSWHAPGVGRIGEG